MSSRQGVIAFGDSITNAGGELQWGVALQSWAMWTARALGVPYTPYAVDGSVAREVIDAQIPLFERVNADPDARFHVGCLYTGNNDVLRPGWDPAVVSDVYETALAFLTARCERVITPNIPLTLGRPPRSERIATTNAIIAAAAERHGALLLDLRDFRARNWVMHDHVHPTAFGQIAIAERALALLAADGAEVRLAPASLINPDPRTWRPSLRTDLRYTRRCALARLAQARRELLS